MSRLTESSLALFCGGLFGAGLALSGMTDPANIIGFLDVTGAWNPQLVFVLAAAVGTSVAGFSGWGNVPDRYLLSVSTGRKLQELMHGY
ncbi:DUF6691 family protein [Aliamphritea spongicola]|nr:DUF6691 family protein [Aliamphritea spongicola]